MLLRTQVMTLGLLTSVRNRIVELRDDDRGDITSTTIIIAVLAALAVAVGAIIVAAVNSHASRIPT